jgi:hypothetical protein
MVIWSILNERAWGELQRKGRLRATPRHADQDFLPAYLWMAQQMERRLNVSRPSRDALPLWAWYQWEGAHRRKPDLRATGHLPKGVCGVRIECHVEEERVLLSDFDLWHYVLNYWYLPKSEEDDARFQMKLADAGLSSRRFDHHSPMPHAQYRRHIESSWERIFDLTWADRGYQIASTPENKSIQATLWEILLDDVVESKEFTAR